MNCHWRYTVVAASLVFNTIHPAWSASPQRLAEPVYSDTINSNIAEIPLESIQQFVQIYGTVKDNYVNDISDDALFLQAIKGMVSGLDRYSRYLSPDEYQQLLQYTEGDLASTDFKLTFDHNKGQWLIKNLKADADSAKLGLKNGDVIAKIEHQEIKSLNQRQVDELLNGAFGSTVQVQQSSFGAPFNLVRNQKLEVADIQANLLPNQILVLKVNVFQQDTATQIKRLIDEYPSNRLKAVLIDLRNNPGGLLSAAVETADLFLNQGIIVSTKSRSEGDQQFQALPGNEFNHLKLGVLINGRSASAAEVFTAAMKEHQRALVIGEKSYGKGVVQKLFPLENSAAIQMTVSHYITPKGNYIDGRGIQPNYEYPWPHDMKEETYIQHVSEFLLKSK